MKIVSTQENTNWIKSNSLYNHPSGLPENDPKKEMPLTNVSPDFLRSARANPAKRGFNARFSYMTYPLIVRRKVLGRAGQLNSAD